jgi:hypothetical protein
MKNEKIIADSQVAKRTIVSFVTFTVIAICICSALWWLFHQPESAGNVQPTLRKSLNTNDKIFSSFFSSNNKSKTFNKSDAVKSVRVNGDYGMDGTLDTATWRLKVARAPGDTLVLTLSEIKALPRTEVVFDFKCIEGWSQITWWAGVRFSDFAERYHLDDEVRKKYCGLITPNEEYYVGIDMPSMLQSQTILCYEMNGLPLPQNQGFPLRLIIPVKYGIKHLKRIGTMYFSDDKPKDYWAEKGYDYYAGL